MSREAPTFKDYYEVLHLHPEADAAMVDQAYWHLARLYNAAIATDGTARPMLEELNEAYSVLRTPELRDEYDNLRDAVLGEGVLPASREAASEPPPLSVMQKQKARARDVELPDEAQLEQEARKTRLPRFRLKLDVRQVAVPDWQTVVSLASMLVLAAAALFAGAQPTLVFFTLIVGVGFTTLPMLARAPKLPSLPRPQVALPAIGPPNLADRLPRQSVNTDKLRQSTEAMVARWRENTEEPNNAAAESEPPRRTPVVPPPENEAEDSLRQSTENVRARLRRRTRGNGEPSPGKSGNKR